jgi:hypothetical protein
MVSLILSLILAHAHAGHYYHRAPARTYHARVHHIAKAPVHHTAKAPSPVRQAQTQTRPQSDGGIFKQTTITR